MDRFTKLIISVVIGLLILIVIFVYLGSSVSNHVRIITVTGGQENAEIVGTKIVVRFSRPVVKDNINDYLQMTPDTPFTSNFLQNDLQIIFKTNLNSGTDYKLVINKDIKDIYGQPMQNDKEFTFKTRVQTITYLKKSSDGDQVVRSNQDFTNQKTLFQSKTIKDFSITKTYLGVIVVNEDKTQNLIIKNLINNIETNFDLKDQTVLSIDINANEALFVLQRVEKQQDYIIPQGNPSVNIYNIDTKEVKLFTPNETAMNVLVAEFSPDGGSILCRTYDSYYYIANKNGTETPIVIGRFQTTGGFNSNLNKIIFTEFDPLQAFTSFPFITVFNSNRELNSITNGETFVIDPKFHNKNDEIVYSEKYKDLGSGVAYFRVVSQDEKGVVLKLLEDENFSLELPQLSFDDKILIAERYTEEDLTDFDNQRDFLNFRKPIFGDLVTYDIENGKSLGVCENCIEAHFDQ